MNAIPHELAFGEVLLPPLLVAVTLGALAAVLTARLLNRVRLSRYFFYPPLLLLAMVVIFTVFFGTFVVRI